MKRLLIQVYFIDCVDKTLNVLEWSECRNTAAKSRLRCVCDDAGGKGFAAFHRGAELVIKAQIAGTNSAGRS